jgi:hypothetical protein
LFFWGLLFFKGLGCSSSGDVFDDVQLQFLLGGADVEATGWTKGTVQSGNGCGTYRSSLDDYGIAKISHV